MKRRTVVVFLVLLSFVLSSEKGLTAAEQVGAASQQQAAGLTVTQQQSTQSAGQALVDGKNAALLLASSSQPPPVLTTAAKTLFGIIQGNTDYRNDMNLLYGHANFPSSGLPTEAGIEALNKITSSSGFDRSVWLPRMHNAAVLYRALRNDSAARAAFNSKYSANLQTTGALAESDRWDLFAVVGTSGYNQASFINSLKASTPAPSTPPPAGSVTLTTAAKTLFGIIQGNTDYRNDMNLLYGHANFPSSGLPTEAGIEALNSIVTGGGYNQSSWLTKMHNAAVLLRAMQANSTYRTKFKEKYGLTVQPSGQPTVQETRWKLFEIVGTSGYNQTAFLSSLVNGQTPPPSTPPPTTNPPTTPPPSLLAAIQANSGVRADMNLLYGTSFQASGTPSAQDSAVLTTIINGGGYSQTAWIAKMQKAASLLRALQANAGARAAFNSRYGANLPSSGTPVKEDRWDLFAIVGDSAYNQANFMNSLGSSTPPPTNQPAVPGQLFSPSSFWNTKLSSSQALHWNSANFVNELVNQTKLSGGTWLNTTQYTTPLYMVDSSTPKAPVSIVQASGTLTYTLLHQELQKGVPIPAGVAASGGTDGTLTIYDQSSDTLYEFWQFRLVNGKYQASWGGVLKNASTSSGIMPVLTRPDGGKEYWGATATGLPSIGGTMLLKELQAGVIKHVLAIAIPAPKNTFVWPASRTDGPATGANAIPEGMRFRFPANITIDPNWSPIMKMMVTAVRDYGLVIRDRAGAVVFTAEDRSRFGSDPYSAYYGGLQLWDVMKQFPWAKLQALA